MYYRLDLGLLQIELYLSLWLVWNGFLSLILHCPNWRQLALLLLLLSPSHCSTVSERVQKPLRITTWFLIPILNHPLRNSDELPMSRISTKPNMSNHLEYSGFIPSLFELFVERLLESDWGVLSMDHSVLPISIAHHKIASQCVVTYVQIQCDFVGYMGLNFKMRNQLTSLKFHELWGIKVKSSVNKDISNAPQLMTAWWAWRAVDGSY